MLQKNSNYWFSKLKCLDVCSKTTMKKTIWGLLWGVNYTVQQRTGFAFQMSFTMPNIGIMGPQGCADFWTGCIYIYNWIEIEIFQKRDLSHNSGRVLSLNSLEHILSNRTVCWICAHVRAMSETGAAGPERCLILVCRSANRSLLRPLNPTLHTEYMICDTKRVGLIKSRHEEKN